MNEDPTQNLLASQTESINQILVVVQDTQMRLGKVEIRLDSLETRLDSLDTRLGRVEIRLDSLESRLGRVEIRLDGLESRMDSLETKVDQRLYDTRPIWEKVIADIEQLQKGQVSLHDEMRKGFRDLKRQFSILNDTFLEVRADYKDLDQRVYQIEEPRT